MEVSNPSASIVLPSFQKPPLSEVVCGLTIEPLQQLLAPHLGLLWLKFRDEYPKCEEVGPLISTAEDVAALDFLEIPPLPRIWFVRKDDAAIIQIQRDRFLHNWRKGPANEYPRYDAVKRMFQDSLSTFEGFLAEMKLGELNVRQCEMTYLNHIPKGEGWSTIDEVISLFPDLTLRDKTSRFLKSPVDVNWRYVFNLPDNRGKLFASIRLAKRSQDNVPIVMFELTVRGKPESKTRASLWEWYDLAREWIVRGFADLTNTSIQVEIWKRVR